MLTIQNQTRAGKIFKCTIFEGYGGVIFFTGIAPETVFLIGISRTSLTRKAVRCLPTCNELYCCMKGPHGYRAFADR